MGSPVVPIGGKSNRTEVKANANVFSVAGGGKRMRAGRGNGLFVLGAFTIFLLVFTMQSAMVDAKRGCANFGHSCYGGMGKRANTLNDEFASQESLDGDVADPALVFTGPRSVQRPLTAQRLLQLRQQFLHDKMATGDKTNELDSDNIKVSPYLKQFLQLYRNMQLQNQHDGPNEQ